MRLLAPRGLGLSAAVALVVVGLSVGTGPTSAQTPAFANSFFLLSTDNKIVTVTEPAVAQPSTPIAITGVTAGETLVSIDVRPQNGKLYALGVNATADTATLYLLNPLNGFAGVVGVPSSIAYIDAAGTIVDLPDTSTVGYDIDFNPAVDRLRVVTSSGLNFRINPNNGTPVDGNLNNTAIPPAGINPDGPINGGTTGVDGTAYTNNVPNNGNITTQYTLDPATKSLYIQNPPNAGTQTLAKPLTLNSASLSFTNVTGFDIASGVNVATANTAVASGVGVAGLRVGTTTVLYRIDLTNGQATLIGSPAGITLRSIAIASSVASANALSADATNLIRFRLDSPATTTTVAITGIAAGEQLVGIDGRPQTGQLFGLGVNDPANTATLYLIDPQTGAATGVGTPGSIVFVDAAGAAVDLPAPSVGYSLDFNPTVDRLRATTGSGLNFRVNPNTGAPVDGNLNNTATPPAGINPDGPISGLGASGTGVTATAYTNNYAQPLTGGVTTQYTIDATSKSLYIQNPPNAGTQTMPLPITLDGAALNFTGINGFDIPPGANVTTSNSAATGNGYAALTVGSTTSIYRINLATGAATLVGPVGAGTSGIAGLAVWDGQQFSLVYLPIIAQ